MEKLWAPWRMTYVQIEKPTGCIFCEKPGAADHRNELVLFRGREVFIVMNLFPYNNGHLMVAPYRTTADLSGEQTPAKSAREQEEAVRLSREPDASLSPEEKEQLLAEVRDPALKCTKCKLAPTRTQVVFGEGSAATPLVFIGEGPGETED